MLQRLIHLLEVQGDNLEPPMPLVGWNYFDLVTHLQRKKLVKYALEQSGSKDYRMLLAPEIAEVAVNTVAYLEKKQELKKRVGECLRIFTASQPLDKDYHEVAVEEASEVLQDWESLESRVTPDLLPLKMRSRQTLISAARILEKTRESQEKLLDLCTTEAVYREYVEEYYGHQGWFILPSEGYFPRTGMVDIVARFLSTPITITTPDQKKYSTQVPREYRGRILEIGYDGYHFLKFISSVRKKKISEKKPLYQAQLPNGERVYFSEESVKGNGDCAFIALGAFRSQVVKSLMPLMENAAIREELSSEIQEALKSKAFEHPAWPSLWKRSGDQYNLRDKEVREARARFPLWQPLPNQPPVEQEISFTGWLEQNHPGTPEIQKIRDQRMMCNDVDQAINDFCQNEAVAKAYVTALGEKLWLGHKSALLYAKQKHFSLYIWSENEAALGNELTLLDHYQDPAGEQVIHMFHTAGFTHFNLLVRENIEREEKKEESWEEEIVLEAARVDASNPLFPKPPFMPGMYALVYIWRKGNGKFSFGHVSMELFDGNSVTSIPVDEGGYISAYPAIKKYNICHLPKNDKEDEVGLESGKIYIDMIGDGVLTYSVVNPYGHPLTDTIFAKEIKGLVSKDEWTLFADLFENETVEGDASVVKRLKKLSSTILNITSKREHTCSPDAKIIYRAAHDDFNTLPDFTFKITVNTAAIATAFRDIKEANVWEWNLTGSGCWRGSEWQTNCGGLVLDLLINQGNLPTDIKREGCGLLSFFDKTAPQKQWDYQARKAYNILSAVQERHRCNIGMANTLVDVFILLLAIPFVQLTLSDVEDPIVYGGSTAFACLMAYWFFATHVTPSIRNSWNTVSTRSGISPEDVLFLLLFLSDRKNMKDSNDCQVTYVQKHSKLRPGTDLGCFETSLYLLSLGGVIPHTQEEFEMLLAARWEPDNEEPGQEESTQQYGTFGRTRRTA